MTDGPKAPSCQPVKITATDLGAVECKLARGVRAIRIVRRLCLVLTVLSGRLSLVLSVAARSQ